RGLAAGYRWPQISIHRGVLQRALLDAAIARIGADRIHFGHHLQRFEALPGGVRVFFSRGRGGEAHAAVNGRLLIAADGIHSAVRSALFPHEGLPRWNGAIMWRGTLEMPRMLDGHTMIMAGHTAQKFVCYPIGHSASTPGY